MPEFVHPAWLALLSVPVLLAVLYVRRAGRARFREATAATLRALTLACLAVALAGPLAGSSVRRTDVVFALDVSSSISREPVADAPAFVNGARALPFRRRVRRQGPCGVGAMFRASEASRAHLVIMRNGALLHESEVQLEPGANVYSFVEQADKAGLHQDGAVI